MTAVMLYSSIRGVGHHGAAGVELRPTVDPEHLLMV
jgi:hypothetical protein